MGSNSKLVFDKGYSPCRSYHDWGGKVHLRFHKTGLDFIDPNCDEETFIRRIKGRLDGMISYHRSLDINDTQFLAERLYLGEAIMLNLGHIDDLVYLGSYRRYSNFVDKFGN